MGIVSIGGENFTPDLGQQETLSQRETPQIRPKPGEVLRLDHPKSGRRFDGRPVETRSREVVVIAAEDCAKVPWQIGEFLRRPTMHRSAVRVRAFEPSARDLAVIYPTWRTPCRLQLGLWNPRTGECGERVGRIYSQTQAADLMELRAACEELMKEPPPATDEWVLAIFAVAEGD